VTTTETNVPPPAATPASTTRERKVVATYDIVESELFDEDNINIRVLDFDADFGYVAERHDVYFVYEGQELFVRVNGVRGSDDVSVLWDQEVISTTRSERGLDGFGGSANAGLTRTQTAGLVVESSLPPASSLVLRVGQVEAGSYEFAICRGASSGDADEAKKKCIQNGARHRLVVQGLRYWGIRAGVGVSVFPHLENQRAERIDGADAYFVRSTYALDWQASIPILATFYFPSRSTGRELQRNDWDLGLAAGANAVRPHRELYFGVHGGWGPAGLFIGYALLRSSRFVDADGEVIPSMEQPDLSDRFRRQTTVEHGLVVSLTFDFDVFKRLYEAVSLDGLPRIGSGTSVGSAP
jgi:hypothetical protein